MIAAILLGGAQLLGEAYAFGDENLAVSDVAPATEAFHKICLRPFSDATGFDSAIAAAANFARVDEKETGTLRRDGTIVPAVGEVWTSPTINIRYIPSRVLGPTSGPQCVLTVRVATAPEPHALAVSVGTKLSLLHGNELRIGTVIRTYWDLVQPEGTRWRVLLKSEGGTRGNYVRLSIAQLGNKP